MRSAASLSVSREAVPLPIATSSTPCAAAGRATEVGDPEPRGDVRLVAAVAGLQRQVEDLLLLAPEHRQHPVRRQPGQRLGRLEVVGELGARLLPAVPYPRGERPPRPHLLAQRTD